MTTYANNVQSPMRTMYYRHVPKIHHVNQMFNCFSIFFFRWHFSHHIIWLLVLFNKMLQFTKTIFTEFCDSFWNEWFCNLLWNDFFSLRKFKKSVFSKLIFRIEIFFLLLRNSSIFHVIWDIWNAFIFWWNLLYPFLVKLPYQFWRRCFLCNMYFSLRRICTFRHAGIWRVLSKFALILSDFVRFSLEFKGKYNFLNFF